jgi:hypothetical protein
MHRIERHRKRKRSRIELCIDLFVAETAYVPDEARPVVDATELSPQLERLARMLRAPDGWRAWAAGPRSWFLDGRLTAVPASSADQPRIMLTFRDNDARAAAAGVWCRTAPGRWEPQQILASSLISDGWH